MSYSTLKFEVNDGVGLITIDRPENANTLNKTMAEELSDVALRCDADDRVRAVIITGSGKLFCAGGDLKSFNEQGDDLYRFLTGTATLFHNAITRFQYMDAPVVMAVNGTAAGGGLSIALSGDYVIAADDAKFVCAYTASGLTPDGSSTFFIAKHVGLLRAKELVLTNRVLDAEEALDWGLVNKVVAADVLMAEATEIATTFAAGPTKAYGGAKRLLLSSFERSIESQLEAESQSIATTGSSRDGRHGIDSFANKRKPVFKGE
ncbi:MAG: enoyl-CoA hydratase/isomerase family protein [Hyphomicrobiaceae bacterium]